jgi:GNAT superfamily N-acetyltransferase
MNRRQIAVRKIDFGNDDDLEAIARMEIAVKTELRPNFRFDFSDVSAFRECVAAIKSVGKGTEIIIAHVSRNVAGYTEYFLNDAYKVLDGRLLFVCPEFRKMGVGTALLNARNKDAKAKGYGAVKINANPDAYGFFEKNGFARASSCEYDSRMVCKL